MTIRPLTNAEVKNAKPQEKDYSIFDGFGLLLYVSRSGGKVWRFRYAHPITGKRQTYTIGKFPQFTLSEAREERERLRRLISRGIDPNEVKKEEKIESRKKHLQTVSAIADEWLKLKNESGIRLNTRKSHEGLSRNIKRVIGGVPVSKLKAIDVIEAFKEYSDRPNMQMRMVACINSIMDYAVNVGIIERNNLIQISKAFPAIKVTPFPALSKDKFPEFMQYWDSQDVYRLMILCLKFQIVTMVRPMEAVKATWDEVDFSRGLWTIPAERMKGKRDHTVPLSDMAITILKEAENWRRGRYVFTSVIEREIHVHRGNISRLIHMSPYRGRVTPHGFRAMASTILNEEGFHPDVIEAALAHKSGDAIRNIYNRTTYLEKRRVMMQWWGEFVEAASRGELMETSGDKGLRIVV